MLFKDLGQYGIAPRTVRTTGKFNDLEGIFPTQSGADRKKRLAWEHDELSHEADRLEEILRPVR